jgi:hypothetical protein
MPAKKPTRHRYPIKTETGYGYIDQTGRVVIKPSFSDAFEFQDGLARVQVEHNGSYLYGFIDESGAVVVEPAYEVVPSMGFDVHHFSQGLCPVKNAKDKFLYIDKQGKPATDAVFDAAFSFQEDRALVKQGKAWGYIDRTGKLVIPCKFGAPGLIESNSFFQDGLALANSKITKNDGFSFDSPPTLGFIDNAGKWVIEPQFCAATAFRDGLAMVRTKDSFGEYIFIDKEGEQPFETVGMASALFYEGLCALLDQATGRCGYIDKTGAWAIKPQFKTGFRFSDGLAMVEPKANKPKGFIDHTGKLAIEPRFTEATWFHNGLAFVTEKIKRKEVSGYINTKGEYVWRDS